MRKFASRFLAAVVIVLLCVGIANAGALITYPRFKADDNNGRPLTSGKLYTYTVGTTTPQATYSDRNLTTPNTNPVILDSRGEAVIYSAGGIKLVLKDSNGVTIWTQDYVGVPADQYVYNPLDYGAAGTQAAISAAISAMASNPRTLYIPAGTWYITSNLAIPSYVYMEQERGAVLDIATGVTLTVNGPVNETLYQKFSWAGTGAVSFADGSVRAVCPQWWGAVVDGNYVTQTGTDNVLAFNAACAAYPVVEVPEGCYKIGTPGVRLVDDQVFVGKGRSATILFAYRTSGTDYFNLITNLNYINSSTTNQTVKVSGMSLYCYGSLLTDVGMSESQSGDAVVLDYANGSVIEDIYMENTALNGVFISDTTDITIRRVVGKNLGRLSYTNMTDPNWTVKAAANGINISNSVHRDGSKILVMDCYIETFRDVAMSTWYTDNATFKNSVARGKNYTGVTTLNTAGVGFSCESSSLNTVYENCRHLDCQSTGFFLSGNGSQVVDCLVKGYTSGTFYGVQAVHTTYIKNFRTEYQGTAYPDNNILITSGAAGVFIDGAQIIGCNLAPCTSKSIELLNVKNFLVEGNTLYGGVGSTEGGIYIGVANVADANYSANGVVRNNTVIKWDADPIYVVTVNDIWMLNNLILGAGNAAFRIDGSDNIHIRNNTAQQYDAGHQLTYSVYYENNPSGGDVLNNYWANYDNSSGNFPYGMFLDTTGTQALVIHSVTGVNDEVINGVLTALIGSYIIRQVTGPITEMVVCTVSGTTWSNQMLPVVGSDTGAQVGTLTNCPVVGDATTYLEVVGPGGTHYYIPAWQKP